VPAHERFAPASASKTSKPARFHDEIAMRAGDAPERRSPDRALRIIVGSGRGRMLHGIEMPAVLVPLRGRVKLTGSDGALILEKGRLFVGEGGSPMQAVGSGDALWIALIAPAAAWRRLVDVVSEHTVPAPALLPATCAADRAIRRAALRIVRESRGRSASEDLEGAILRFVALLLDVQAVFDPLIRRCPGRTLGQRRGVFVRLQRVCHQMQSSSDLDPGIAGFARVANYSPCHFIRTFNAVYGKTPHAVLIEQRLKRALELVNDTELSIAEVAHASGFEDRCAFARSFKRQFGATATAVRERKAVSA
jgi:AraC family transcriptional regulator